MHGALSPWFVHHMRPPASSMLPILSWDGRTPTSLIGHVEASLAGGMRFVVLAATSPLGRVADRGFLEGWWRAVQPRLAGMCDGWAVIAPDADAHSGHFPAQLMRQPSNFAFVDFPVRFCAERAEALGWLQARGAKLGQGADAPRFQ